MNLCVVPHINTHTVFPENPFRKVHKCQKIIKFYPKKVQTVQTLIVIFSVIQQQGEKEKEIKVYLFSAMN